MSKISELSDGGSIQSGDTLIAVRSGGNVKVTYGGTTTANIDGGTIDGTVIGGSSAAAITGTTITGTSFVSSGDMTFGDNDKAVFGAGSDLEIYHDGSNSFINETGTGSLYIGAESEVQLRSYSTNEKFLVGTSNGATSLYYNGVRKLDTTNTGIDVTGTVTADGLSVRSTSASGTVASFKGSTGFGLAISASAVAPYVQDIGTAAGEEISLSPGGVRTALFQDGGDISFYEDTGTTAKFFWDASAESLGIGTSSPYTALDVSGGTTNQVGIFRSTDATATIGFADNTTPLTGNLSYVTLGAVGNNMVFNTNLTEAMRIDSSSNLLVGTTSSPLNLAISSGLHSGMAFDAVNDVVIATRASGHGLIVNRTGTDGDIMQFRKDGTTVGSIGTLGGELFIQSDDVGLQFDASGNNILPYGGGFKDSLIDLGESGQRFKDLYLSGGVYLGGTGAANKLDDYEEGTFTPTLTPNTSGTISLDASSDAFGYVKIGNLVTLTGTVKIASVASPVGSYFTVSLPFVINNLVDDAEKSSGAVTLYDTTSNTVLPCRYVSGSLFRVFIDCSTLGANYEVAFSASYRA